jgi:hypothetical protein
LLGISKVEVHQVVIIAAVEALARRHHMHAKRLPPGVFTRTPSLNFRLMQASNNAFEAATAGELSSTGRPVVDICGLEARQNNR